MTTFKFNSIAILVLLAFLNSCSSNSSSNSSTIGSSSYSSSTSSSNIAAEKDPYEIMNVAFVGNPQISEIKPLMESVMDNYNLPQTNENKLKVGSMLVALRKSNTVGVTEMDILKHIYRYGSNKLTLPEQAGISSTLLITSK